MSALNDLGDRMLADSARWFPELHASQHTAAVHFALGLAGEVGELVNLVKKVNRGDTDYAAVRTELGHEVADVLTYSLDLARTLGIDVDQALAEKREICEARWGMSYLPSVDEMSEGSLAAELQLRANLRAAGLCDYCLRRPTTRPCKFPKRHSDGRIGASEPCGACGGSGVGDFGYGYGYCGTCDGRGTTKVAP